MKERPILMNDPMVCATLEDRKTHTRRVVKLPKGYEWTENGYVNVGGSQGDIIPCPYGKAGDRLWVRENFRLESEFNDVKPSDAEGSKVFYPADLVMIDGEIINPCDRVFSLAQCRPSIHMPRWASRITLEITGVRVDRLNEISEQDAIAEGVHTDDDYPTESACPRCHGEGTHGDVGKNLGWIEVECGECKTAKQRFKHLWESINGAGSWELNPFVWVVEFKRIQP